MTTLNPKIIRFFERHIATVLDKQLYLQYLVDGLRWRFKPQQGTVRFGSEHEWNVQIIGLEKDGTWEWGWGPSFAEFHNSPITESAHELRELAELPGLADLDGTVDLDSHDGGFWASISVILADAAGYLCCPWKGGQVYLLIKDDRFRRRVINPLGRFQLVLPRALDTYPVHNHRTTVEHYGLFLGLRVERAGDCMLLQDCSGRILRVEFHETRVDLIAAQPHRPHRRKTARKEPAPHYRFAADSRF